MGIKRVRNILYMLRQLIYCNDLGSAGVHWE